MNILKKTQNALAAWLSAQDLGDIPAENVYKGIDNPIDPDDETAREVRNIPCVICQCDRADAKEFNNGMYTAHARVIIKGSADDLSDDEFSTLADTACNFIETDSIATDLTAALSNYTAEVVRIKSHSYQVVERTWEHYLDIEIDCCGSDIS